MTTNIRYEKDMAATVAEKFDDWPGYRLVAYGAVGIPVQRLFLSALILERRSVDAIDEFIMRGIGLGMEDETELAGLLGISPGIVNKHLADLFRHDLVSLRASATEGSGDQLRLTPKGQEAVDAQVVSRPAESTIVLTFDALLRSPRWYADAELIEQKHLKAAGIPELPGKYAAPPSPDEIDVASATEQLGYITSRKIAPSVLSIRRIERTQRRYREAVALAYAPIGDGERRVRFAVDGRLSEEHGDAIIRDGGIKRSVVFQRIGTAEDIAGLDGLLGKQLAARVASALSRRPNAEKKPARRIVVERRPKGGGVSSVSTEPLDAREDSPDAPRAIAPYEYYDIFGEVIEAATERLIISSSCLRGAVADSGFLGALRKLLKRGVKIGILCSSGDNGPVRSEDVDARLNLERLTIDFEGFRFKHTTDACCGALVKDAEYCIITSFRWLGFRGDARQPLREEVGVRLARPSDVERVASEVYKRIVDQPSSAG